MLIEITPKGAVLNGRQLTTSAMGSKLLTELYRLTGADYPKFFKMDTLSRLGFVASELLLQDEAEQTGLERFQERHDRAVVFANRSASIKNDRDYLKTIGETYFPSPSLFVYTLPNIVTGEVCIRNCYRSESAFYVLNNPEQLLPLVQTTMGQNGIKSALAAWLECSAADDFYCRMWIASK